MEVIVKSSFVIVIAAKADGSVVCVRQFRHPFQQAELSFPAGHVDAGEDPEAAARRELQEEAGLKASRMVKLGEVHEVPEFARSVGHVFAAEGLEPVATGREEGERTMKIEEFKEAELKGMIRRGKVKSVTVIAAWHLYLAYRERSQLSTHSAEAKKSMGLFHCPALDLPNMREVALGGLICVAYFWGRRASRSIA